MIPRRSFLKAAGAAIVLGPRGAHAADDDAVLVQHVGSPQTSRRPSAWFDRLITPTDVFFVRSHFGPPSLDTSRKVTIAGTRTIAFDAAGLRAQFPEVTLTAVLQCAGNGRSFHSPRVPGVQWDHGAMGQATFTGVRLKDVLTDAGLPKDAAFVALSGADSPPKPEVPAFVRSIPLARAMDPTTLIAWSMNGAPLTHAHGAPLRLIVPGWAGDHWIKWLTHVTPRKDEAPGFWMQSAYKFPIEPAPPGAAVPPEKMRSLTTFPVKSLIARPSDGGKSRIGPQEVTGCAVSGDAPIAKVEVSTDEGATWHVATLEGDADTGRWQIFRHRFDVKTPGRATAKVRATDKKGHVQPEKAIWNPSGYFWNAWHTVSWEVTA